jgi:hypothetical protein
MSCRRDIANRRLATQATPPTCTLGQLTAGASQSLNGNSPAIAAR